MVKIENGHLMLGGDIKEIFTEAVRLADIVTAKLAEVSDDMQPDQAIEFFLELMDQARKDRETGGVLFVEAASTPSAKSKAGIEQAFQDTIKKIEAGGSPEIVTTELTEDLRKKGFKIKGDDRRPSIYDLEVSKKEKKDKKNKKEKKEKKDKKDKKGQNSSQEPQQNFPYIKPQPFKKKNQQ